jgi:hypothetical protein
MSRAQDLVDALIAHASREGLGELVAWNDVEAAIMELAQLPDAATALRRQVDRLNDPEVALTLQDWFVRAADSRERDGKRAARPAEKILGPLQGVSLGAAATSAFFAAAGTLTLAAAFPAGLAALVIAGGTSYGRWRLSEREDDAKADANAIRRFAQIAVKA